MKKILLKSVSSILIISPLCFFTYSKIYNTNLILNDVLNQIQNNKEVKEIIGFNPQLINKKFGKMNNNKLIYEINVKNENNNNANFLFKADYIHYIWMFNQNILINDKYYNIKFNDFDKKYNNFENILKYSSFLFCFYGIYILKKL
jgi:hypothetical protein